MNDDSIIRQVSDGFDSAKAGNALQTYTTLLPLLENNTLPAKSHYPFGWIIYYAIHQSDDTAIIPRKHMLANYLKLRVAKPHKLHSMILTEAIRLHKDAKNAAYNRRKANPPSFSIMKFTDLWNLDFLRPGDWRRHELNGKTLGSTVEKLITACVDELEDTHAMPSEIMRAVVDKALTEYPDSASLLAQRASLYILEGNRQRAKDLLRNALIVAPGKFHLWSRLASLTPAEDNPRLHIALLYKALRAPGSEQFKGRIRLALAQAWLSRNMTAQARWELEKVKALYEANGWHLPKTYTEALNQIPTDMQAEDPLPFYRKVEHLADEEIYAALPEIHATKNYHKIPDPKNQKPGYGTPAIAWRVADANGKTYWLQPHRFGIDPDLPMGTKLLIRLHNGKTVKARLADA